MKTYEEIMEVANTVSEVIQENNDTLTQEQIEEVVESLTENVGTQSQSLRNIKEELEYPHHLMNRGDLVKGTVPVTYVAETGELQMVEDEAKQTPINASLSDIIDGNTETLIAQATDETMKDGLKELGMEDTDVLKFIEVLNKHKSGEKVSYNELPEMAKQMIDGLNGFQKVKVKQSMINGVLDYFINELNLDQEFVDFQTSLKQELEIPGLADLYSDHLRESMEVKLLETADKLDDINKEKANTLREISKTFTETYTFSKLIELVKSNDKAAKRLDKEISKFNRYCREFNFKYQKSSFAINDISLVYKTLVRHLPEFSDDKIKAFIILFCRSTINLSPDNVVEHSYMYYTIKNILALDYIENDKNTFKEELLENLTNLLNII